MGQICEYSSWPKSMKSWDQRELEDLELENIPHYNPYEDETQNEQSFTKLVEELETMPKVADQFIGAEMLPRGNQMTRGHVVAQSCDANRNVFSRANANPILDTRLYQVELQS